MHRSIFTFLNRRNQELLQELLTLYIQINEQDYKEHLNTFYGLQVTQTLINTQEHIHFSQQKKSRIITLIQITEQGYKEQLLSFYNTCCGPHVPDVYTNKYTGAYSFFSTEEVKNYYTYTDHRTRLQRTLVEFLQHLLWSSRTRRLH